MSWSRWNWLDDGVLPLAVAILRVCWLWPWLSLLQRWLVSSFEGMLLPVGLTLGLLLGGTIVARRALTLSSKRARAIVAVTGLIVILLASWWQLYRAQDPLWSIRWVSRWGREATDWTDWELRGIPPPFFALLAMGYLWLQGILDGGRLSLVREHVWRAFNAGLIALALLLMAGALDKRGLPEGTGSLVWLFFLTGLFALALTGLKMAGGLDSAARSGDQGVEIQVRYDRYWIGSVVSVVAGILGLGLALSALIAPESVGQALGAVWIVIRQLLIYLWIIISLILLPFAYLLALALRPLLDRLAEFLNEVWGVKPLRAPELPEALKPEGLPNGGVTLLERFPEGLRWVALGMLILLIGLAFAVALRRLLSGTRAQNGILESRETILSRDLLQDQLSDLWRNWLSRLQRQPKRPFNPFLSLEGEAHTRQIIRSVYQAVLEVAKERGRPRAPWQTPVEYRSDLSKVWPDSVDALGVITEGYVKARYAAEPPTPEQAQRVQKEWERVQMLLEAQDVDETEGER